MGLTQTTRADVVVDTSDAPWMKIAYQELGKKIREVQQYETFKVPLLRSLTQNTPKGLTLLDWEALNQDLVKSFSRAASPYVARKTAQDNPEIAQYLRTVKTDPAGDRKGRSFELSMATETKSGWQVTAWCAAFVNWCLAQADAPRLGYATAASWLRFGTPIAAPIYGCVTIIRPARDTGSTTGHVAFFVREKAKNIVLLGGNQSDQVKESEYAKSNVLGYRWPTRVNAVALGTVIV